MLSLIAAAAVASSTPQCAAIDGTDAILAQKDMGFLVVGELHGTAETPAAFADLVCIAGNQRGPVIVGVEFPVSDQSLIDQFMASNDLEFARKELMKTWVWKKSEDGRGSVAMLAMFERLRQYVRMGIVKRVVTIQPIDSMKSNEGYEKEMAQPLIAAQRQDGHLTLVLVGNAHASFAKIDIGEPLYWPMAHWLPKKQTVTLYTVSNGGSAWNCQGEGIEADGKPTIVCKAHSERVPQKLQQRGIVLSDEAKKNGYSGALRLGVETQASPPAKYENESD